MALLFFNTGYGTISSNLAILTHTPTSTAIATLDNAEAYYNRGLAYATKSDKGSTSADFKKVLELCGNFTYSQEA